MKSKSVACLLTGRGNNTLKDKNLLDLLGKPVLFYPAEAGRRAKLVDRHFISSDDPAILAAAEGYGYETIVRPAELATPSAQHIDAILHALNEMSERGVDPDILVVTLANNVTIEADWIDDCVKLMLDDPSLTAVAPVYKDMDHHPIRAKRMGADGFLDVFIRTEEPVSSNRQDLEKCYFLCHNFWVLNVSKIEESMRSGQPPWTFMGDRVKAYEVPCSIDIHDEFDMRVAAEWLNYRKK